MTDPKNAYHVGRNTLVIISVLLLMTLFASLLDERTFFGASVWSKPLKFNFSFALHIATMMVFLSFLRPEIRTSAVINWTMVATCTAVIIELFYISFQAARGRASHFNRSTTWEELAYYAMGAGVALVMIGTLIVGIAVWRNARPEIGPALRLGVGLGSALGSIATIVTAGAMSSMQFTSTGHWVGGELTDATGLPIVGWSTTGGDLRVSHFFAIHLIQVLPIVGWLADRSGISFPRLLVCIATVLGLVLVWFTFQQALSGRPLLPYSTRQ